MVTQVNRNVLAKISNRHRDGNLYRVIGRDIIRMGSIALHHIIYGVRASIRARRNGGTPVRAVQ